MVSLKKAYLWIIRNQGYFWSHPFSFPSPKAWPIAFTFFLIQFLTTYIYLFKFLPTKVLPKKLQSHVNIAQVVEVWLCEVHSIHRTTTEHFTISWDRYYFFLTKHSTSANNLLKTSMIGFRHQEPRFLALSLLVGRKVMSRTNNTRKLKTPSMQISLGKRIEVIWNGSYSEK